MPQLIKSSSEGWRKDIQDFTESLATMTVGTFFGWGNLGVGAAQALEIEDRIVTESARTPGFTGNQAFSAIRDHRLPSAMPRNRSDANEPGAALPIRFMFQFTQKFMHPIRIRRVWPRVTR